MGLPKDVWSHRGEGKPQHVVRITKPFYLSVTEVTQEQYQAVMGQNPTFFKDDPRRPVECVSWEDAVEFCGKLSGKEGRTYRLPTEAEWEYACRAGSTTKWSFGDDESELWEYAWYYGNSEATTHPVGEKKPNNWGLYDMHGNVWEWCADWHGWKYYAESPRDDPQGPKSGSARVNRGGTWAYPAGSCYSAGRCGLWPEERNRYLGFRVARSPSGE
jgi:formylglycine-generating enzyme required for sulfatase activity